MECEVTSIPRLLDVHMKLTEDEIKSMACILRTGCAGCSLRVVSSHETCPTGEVVGTLRDSLAYALENAMPRDLKNE